MKDFETADAKGKGLIGREEMAQVLMALDPKTWDDKTAHALMDVADRQHSGTIEYHEFVEWLKGGEDHEDVPAAVLDKITSKKRTPDDPTANPTKNMSL